MAAHGAAFFVYAVLTLVLCWPLVSAPAPLVPSDLGDPLLSTWILWWNAHVLPLTERWWDGLAFFPARDTLTFSDHRLGISLITTPLIRLGVSPLASYNVAFLLSFFLSATAAYALCWTLARDRAAAFVGGLVFGFNPFRAAHLPHLELLASYFLPLVLLALHRWASTLRSRWLVLLTIVLILQAVTSGYYFAFSAPLIGLWLLWFTPRSLSIRQYAGLATALLLPLAVIAPLLSQFREAHARLGMFRGIAEIELFSADALAFITAPEPLAFWNTPPEWQRGEQALLPGATVVLLIVAASLRRWRPAGIGARSWRTRAGILLLVLAAGATALAVIATLHGPVAYDIAGLHVSVTRAYKPLSIAALSIGVWVLTSARVREAWRTQSLFAFYVLATIAMFTFALGPTARVLGYRVLYKAPYSWLMLLPGFRDEFRVPARFGMLAALTLSVAGAIALSRLMAARPVIVRNTAAIVVATAIMLESWIAPFPTRPAPTALVVPPGVPADAAIVELPVHFFRDATAMYHSIDHQRRTVNGMSGYLPPHYGVVVEALEEGRVEVLSVLASYADIAVFVPRSGPEIALAAQLQTRALAAPLAETETHNVLMVPRRAKPEARSPTKGAAIPLSSLTSNINASHVPHMLDGDRDTVWSTLTEQRGNEEVLADLGEVLEIAEITLALGYGAAAFPRTIAVELSMDATTWIPRWQGDTAAAALVAAIEDPRDVTISFPFSAERARYIRVKQLGQSAAPWIIAEFRVFGSQRRAQR